MTYDDFKAKHKENVLKGFDDLDGKDYWAEFKADLHILLASERKVLELQVREVWDLLDSEPPGPGEGMVSDAGLVQVHLDWSARYLALRKKHGIVEKQKSITMCLSCGMAFQSNGTLLCRECAGVSEKPKSECTMKCLERWPDMGHHPECPTRKCKKHGLTVCDECAKKRIDLARLDCVCGRPASEHGGCRNYRPNKPCPSTYTHSSLGKLACEKDEGHLHRIADVEHRHGQTIWMSI
jgi:hypothetical protein